MATTLLRGGAGLLLSLALLPACHEPTDDYIAPAQAPTTVAVANWAARADSAQAVLRQSFYSPSSHYFLQNNSGRTDFNYWWQAHGTDVLLDGYQRNSAADFLTQVKELQAGMKAQNNNTYINTYYDDMEWEALACLRAYQITRDEAYKTTATQLWTDIKLGWNEQQGGGIAWRKTQLSYKNTPANAPAAILAARLYQLDRNPDDLAWAQKIYQWQKKTLVDPATGAVWDGINSSGNGQVDRAIFTYGQGVYLGAGLALYQATQQTTYLDDATRTASYVLNDSQLAPGGVLKDEGGGDGGLFKGILVRYLALLATEPAVNATSRASYISFLKFNGQSLSQRATRRPQYLFNTSWTSQPNGAVDASTELSGVMLLEVLANLQARKLL